MSGLLAAVQAVIFAVIASWLGISEDAPAEEDRTESRMLLKISLEQPVKVTDPCAQAKAA